MKQENQIKVDSLNRDRDRLSMIQTIINQFENGEPMYIAGELQKLRDKQNDIRYQIDQIKKIDQGLDIVEEKLKKFIELNNLDWTYTFHNDHFSIRIKNWELMHEGIMAKFDKEFYFELEEYEEDDFDRGLRYSYSVTDTK